MRLLSTFFPDELQASAYGIDYEAWYAKGCRGLIFDIDNTLVPHGADSDEAARSLFARVHELGFRTLLLSNNKEARVRRFNEGIGTDYIFKAGKPAGRGYQEAMKRMGTEASQTLFIGDQLFTDVWGAKKAGIYCILVNPIDPREKLQIALKRYPERIILYFYRRRRGGNHED